MEATKKAIRAVVSDYIEELKAENKQLKETIAFVAEKAAEIEELAERNIAVLESDCHDTGNLIDIVDLCGKIEIKLKYNIGSW